MDEGLNWQCCFCRSQRPFVCSHTRFRLPKTLFAFIQLSFRRSAAAVFNETIGGKGLARNAHRRIPLIAIKTDILAPAELNGTTKRNRSLLIRLKLKISGFQATSRRLLSTNDYELCKRTFNSLNGRKKRFFFHSLFVFFLLTAQIRINQLHIFKQ